MKKNELLTVIIVAVMAIITGFVLINTGYISKVFKLKADINSIELGENEAMFIAGSSLNDKMKRLADSETEYFSEYGYESPIYHIERSNTIDDENKSKNNFVSIDSGKPIYMWFDEEDGTIYYYTDASTIYLNPDSYSMFFDLKNLIDIDLSEFDSSKATSMYNMFANCESLTEIDLSSWDTNNVTNMSGMFSGCTLLEQIDFGHDFNTSKVTDMYGMFENCESLEEIDLSRFDTSEVTNMYGMFFNCISLTNIIYGDGWNTSKASSFGFMFAGCESIETIDLSKYNASNVENIASMFSGCTSLKTIIYPTNWDTSKVINMMYLFEGCESIENIDMSNYDTSNVTNMMGLFDGCKSLKTLNISSFNTANVTNMSGMFQNCLLLTNITFGDNFDTSSVTNMRHMFDGCISLTNIDLSKFNTSQAIDMREMFRDCVSLTTLNVSNFDTNNVIYMDDMFAGPESLDDYGKMMSLTQIIGLDKWNTSSLKSMQSMFKNNVNLTAINVSSFDTSNVTEMGGLFYGCPLLTTIDLSNFDTSKVENMTTMFQYDSELTTIYVSDKFVIKTGAIGNYMFNEASKLKGQNGTTYSFDHIDIEYARVDTESAPGYFSDIDSVEFTITYNLNGGRETVSNPTTYTYSSGNIIIAHPERDGYTFVGWLENDSTTPKSDVIITTGSSGNIVLTAVWEENGQSDTKYIIDEENERMVVNKVFELSELKTILGNDIVLKDNEGNVKSDTSKLGTGNKLIVGQETYDISVKGDLSGDGETMFEDVSISYTCFKTSSSCSDTLKIAADVSNNNAVGFDDISIIYGLFKNRN